MTPTSCREFLSFWRQTPATSPSTTSVPAVTPSSELLRLRTLQQTVLDAAATDAHFRDLSTCTTVQAVIPKYARNGLRHLILTDGLLERATTTAAASTLS